MKLIKLIPPFYLGFALISILFFVGLVWGGLVPSEKYDIEQMEYNYQNSHLVDPGDFEYEMFDWDLYAYAGYKYVTTGDVASINFEHPPLGKYLYGLSILWFGHQNWVQIFYGLMMIGLMYVIGWQLFKSKNLVRAMIYSLIAPMLMIIDGLFWYQVKYTLLDLPMVVLFLLFILMMVLRPLNKWRYKKVLLGVVLGLSAGVKFMAPAVVLFISYLVYELMKDGKKFKLSVLVSQWSVVTSAIITYLLVYFPLILKSGIFKFVSVHFDAIKLHLSHVPNYPLFVPMKVMFFNQWPVWWDEVNPVHQVGEWSILWAVVAIVIIVSSVMLVWDISKKKKMNPKVGFLVVFGLLYFVFINSRLFFPSYLLPILPVGYLLLVWGVRKYMVK